MPKYRVLIAEDELLIREGLVETIAWESLQTEVVATARNGKEALALAKDADIDILITDIQMPGCDGISLITQMKKFREDLRCIIVSGYDNFSYAQQAIRLGVTEYILKPIDIDQLTEAIARIVTILDAEQEQRETMERWGTFYEEHSRILLEEFFQNLLFDNLTPAEVEQELKLQQYERAHHFHLPVVVLTEMRPTSDRNSIRDMFLQLFSQEDNQSSLQLETGFFLRTDILYQQITLVFSAPQDSTSVEDATLYLETKLKEFDAFPLLGVGIGESCTKLMNLPYSYQKARTHALFTLFGGLESSALSAGSAVRYAPLSFEHTTKVLYDLFAQRELAPLEDYITSIEMEIQREDRDLEFTQSFLRVILVCVLAAGDELGISVRKFFPDSTSLHQFVRIEEPASIVKKIADACRYIATNNSINDHRSSTSLMEQIHQHVLAHFTNPLLSIESISEHFGITPSYCSRLSKQAFGMTYSKFIVQIRMQEAQRLLKSYPDMKISNLATHVGFNSPSYFNYSFKKHFGMTPKEYQLSVGSSSEDP